MGGARKDDQDKLRYDLIPVVPLKELARVFTIGARKYGDRNWEKGFAFSRVSAALDRHHQAWKGGEYYDSANGQHHLASVAWCAFVLMELQDTHFELNDLPDGPNFRRGEGGTLDRTEQPAGKDTSGADLPAVSDRQLSEVSTVLAAFKTLAAKASDAKNSNAFG